MASRAKSICRKVACGKAIDAPGYCDKHKKDASGWHATSTKSDTERGYGWAWRKLRNRIMIRDCGICQANTDGCRIVATEVDHILPKAKGGTDAEYNLRAICRVCHAKKTALDRSK